MAPVLQWAFGPFRLDATSGSLWRDDALIALSPKPAALLVCLVAKAGEVVPKESLLDTVWPETAVTEGVLKTAMGRIRQALGDSAQAPQFIETIPRRGYRFIAPVEAITPSLPAAAPPATLDRDGPSALPFRPAPSSPPAMLLDREGDLAQLRQRLRAAQDGQRQMLFVSGEAGIGKTALVDAFVQETLAAHDVWVSWGQCIDHYGAGEPYLPLLDALGQLLRAPQGAPLVALLHQHAPSWLLQLPALVSEAEFDRLQQRASGATRERMLRELAEFMDTLTAERPLVLVLEDLHWSDVSTLDWLAYTARRRQPACLFIVGTYRPVEAVVRAHPVRAVSHDLHVHGYGMELALDYLSEAGVTAYLQQRLESVSFPAALGQRLYRRTHGNPLFLRTLVDALVHQGVLRVGVPGEELAAALTVVEREVPGGIQQLITQQVEQLTPDEQRLLEAASVAGKEFAIEAVAACLEGDAEGIESQCASWARRGQFVQACGMEQWPDGTVSARYRFIHDLYHEVVYEQIGASRRSRWHRRIGEHLEAYYGSQAQAIAAELALHFVQGRDTERGVQYLQQAGENAQQRHAHQEAIDHFTTGLELLGTLPDTPERAQQELTLHLALGPALAVTCGYAAPEVEQTYLRAQALCHQHNEGSRALLALQGLWFVYNERLWCRQARDLGEQYLALAQRGHDPVALVEAGYALGASLYYLGEFPAARWHLEQGIACYNRQREHFWGSRTGLDPGVSCLAVLASTLGFLGYPDQAQQRADEARHLAQELAHPYSLAFAQYRAGFDALFRRQARAAQGLAEEVLGIATTHGFPFYEALGTALKGGAFVRQGQGEEGLALLRQGLAALANTGTQPAPHWLVWHAGLCGHAGQFAEGLRLLEEAMTQAEITGNVHAMAELYRLKGECFMALTAAPPADIESCFRQALAISRRQQAKTLELRAAVSLSRFWHRQDQRAPARRLLAEVYDWFTEGFDTADLQEAKALLETCG